VRLAGFLALLVGILLLQTTLCDGPVADAAPCIESCERVAHTGASTQDTQSTAAPGPVPADHHDLVELCLTVLIAVLVALAALRRPWRPAGTPPVTVQGPPPAGRTRAAAGRPCVLRL